MWPASASGYRSSPSSPPRTEVRWSRSLSTTLWAASSLPVHLAFCCAHLSRFPDAGSTLARLSPLCAIRRVPRGPSSHDLHPLRRRLATITGLSLVDRGPPARRVATPPEQPSLSSFPSNVASFFRQRRPAVCSRGGPHWLPSTFPWARSAISIECSLTKLLNVSSPWCALKPLFQALVPIVGARFPALYAARRVRHQAANVSATRSTPRAARN